MRAIDRRRGVDCDTDRCGIYNSGHCHGRYGEAGRSARKPRREGRERSRRASPPPLNLLVAQGRRACARR
jgi:hypothetical protein